MAEPDRPPGEPAPAKPSARAGKRRAGSKSGTVAHVTRENDMMRAGVDGHVLDLSLDSLTVQTPMAFGLGEQVKVRLQNIVQRCDKEVRGAVRKIEPADEGWFDLSIEMFTRLSALEISLFKMGIPLPGSKSKKHWF